MVTSMRNEIEFKEYETDIVSNKKSAVLYFFADWCISCKTVSALVETESSDDSIIWLKMNTEEAPNIVKHYKIKGLPSLLFFKEGTLYSRMTGNISRDELSNKLVSIKEGK